MGQTFTEVNAHLMICKYKVGKPWRTGLSPSVVLLSKSFCSIYQFLTLCRLMVAPAA
jgi:hypothetical protein